MVSVGIIGLGAVGSAVESGMKKYYKILSYDIDGRGSFEEILGTEVVFICVPTAGLANTELDMSNVDEIVCHLANTEYSGLIIVKSTLQPNTMSRLEREHPELNLCYMPEFLREKDAKEWFINPDRLVASGSPNNIARAFDLFDWVPKKVPRLAMSHLEAELGKLAHNAYIATKVTFTCEIERICNHRDVDPMKVMEVVWQDRRVGNSAHLIPGLGGFGGKCVPKDTHALRLIDPDKDSLLECVLKRGNAEYVKARKERTVERG